MRERLKAIETSLRNDNYRVGDWQSLVSELDRESITNRRELREEVSRVSVLLHGRNGFLSLPFLPVYLMELALLMLGIVLIGSDQLVVDLVGCFLLGVTAQPVIKVSTGLILGLRYEYAFLWFFEPRFKMKYGHYLCLAPLSRVVLHTLGSLGTPLALWIAYLQLTPHVDWLGFLALMGCLATALMQVAAFAAEWLGVRRIGRFRLSQLTSPATAAFEFKKMLAEQEKS